MKREDKDLYAMRHSLAHIMAAAIARHYPEAKFGVGPPTDEGFYYDVDFGSDPIGEADLSAIEKEMKKIIKEDFPFEQYDMSIDEALTWAEETGQTYKKELLIDLKEHGTTNLKEAEDIMDNDVNSASFYRCGSFEDLCKGPHVASTGKVGAFKLHRLAGAYWRGDESKPQLQRVYGLGFPTQEDLDQYLARIEEAEKRDHRKLGKELDLFVFSDLVGSGLPLFTPRGTILRDKLNDYAQQLRSDIGYSRVAIPHVTKTDLYKTSGHWDKFGDELFLVTSQETSDELALKPMNCPHHTQLYASTQRSYRDLPVKYMETTTTYRDEKSGELHGLSRVRAISMDDTHAFVRPDQVESVVGELLSAALKLYETLDMRLKFRLSFRDDSDGYLGDDELWSQAQTTLEELAKKHELEYYIEEGEAAFYGPKIDYVAVDALDREWQVATVQLDFVQPKRFSLEYVDEEGERKTPVMIHAALLGSIERFLSVYIEHTGGRFPFWLAPEQVRILTINDQVLDYVDEITAKTSAITLDSPVRHNELRVGVDSRSESLGKKIRDAETAKVPLIMIVGPKDEAARQVSLRASGAEDTVALDKLEEVISSL